MTDMTLLQVSSIVYFFIIIMKPMISEKSNPSGIFFLDNMV